MLTAGLVAMITILAAATLANQLLQRPVAAAPPAGDINRERIEQSKEITDPGALILLWSTPFVLGEPPFPRELQQRLLAAVEARPDLLSRAAGLPTDEASLQRIRRIATPEAHEWLRLHDPQLTAELLDELDRSAERDAYPPGNLRWMVATRWNDLEPLLTRWERSTSPTRRIFAAATRNEHSTNAALREQLKHVAEDRSATPIQRWAALDSLVPSKPDDDWPGRDAWVLSLFSDTTWINMHEGSYGGDPFVSIARFNPDHWIPRIAPLVKNPATRENAALALAGALQNYLRRSAYQQPNPEFMIDYDKPPSTANARLAARALLPWLHDATWIAGMHDQERKTAWQAAAELRLIDSAKEIRERIAKHNESDRAGDWKALLSFHAVSLEEQTAALVRYVHFAANPENASIVANPWSATLPPNVSLGRYLAGNIGQHELVALCAIRTAAEDQVLLICAHASTPKVARAIVNAIARNEAGPDTIAYVLSHRANFDAAARGTRAMSPGMRAVLAVIAGDAAQAARIGKTNTNLASLVLAAARLALLDLPSQEWPAGADAALDAYLTAVDTPATRSELYARHPGMITFSGIAVPPSCAAGPFADREETLRAEVAARPDEEIFALLRFRGQPCGFEVNPVIVRITSDAATLTSTDRTTRALSTSEVDELLRAAASWNVARPVIPSGSAEAELVHVAREGARRTLYGPAWGAPLPSLALLLISKGGE